MASRSPFIPPLDSPAEFGTPAGLAPEMPQAWHPTHRNRPSKGGSASPSGPFFSPPPAQPAGYFPNEYGPAMPARQSPYAHPGMLPAQYGAYPYVTPYAGAQAGLPAMYAGGSARGGHMPLYGDAYADPYGMPPLMSAGGGGGAYGAYGNPHAPALRPREEPAWGPPIEVDAEAWRWSEEPNLYGPVLSERAITALKPRISLNPLLFAHAERHIVWDLRLPQSTATLSDQDRSRAWSAGRKQSATHPAVETLHIASKSFPFLVRVHNSRGVRCEDILVALQAELQKQISRSEYDALPQQVQRRLKAAYPVNTQAVQHRMAGLIRVEWLGADTHWDGLAQDEEFVRKQFNIPAWRAVFVLQSRPR